MQQQQQQHDAPSVTTCSACLPSQVQWEWRLAACFSAMECRRNRWFTQPTAPPAAWVAVAVPRPYGLIKCFTSQHILLAHLQHHRWHLQLCVANAACWHPNQTATAKHGCGYCCKAMWVDQLLHQPTDADLQQHRWPLRLCVAKAVCWHLAVSTAAARA